MNPTIHACTTLDRRHSTVPHGMDIKEAISLNGKTWHPGDVIKIGFLDGSPSQQSKARHWASYWLQWANLRFDFSLPDPDVRITFAPGGSWSYIGTDCRTVPSGPTMQLGWVTDVSQDDADRAVIVHECGHMLGLGHEQSSPLEDIQWDKPKALAWYEETQGWTAQMVEDNVFSVYAPSQVTGTAYDRSSIMQYPVDASLTLDGRGIGWNSDLSSLDKTYIATLYPTPHVTPTPTPIPIPIPTPTPVSPGYPAVTIGGHAIAARIPAPGQPARFALTVATDSRLLFESVVQPSFGRTPVITINSPHFPAVPLPLYRGAGQFALTSGSYLINVYDPFPRLTGTAWLKVSQA